MASERPCVEVLLIQFWVNGSDRVTAALANAGLRANIKRVDIEPAVYAALGRRPHDLVLFDPSTPALTVDTVQSCMRSHGSKAVLVVMDERRPLDETIASAIRARQS